MRDALKPHEQQGADRARYGEADPLARASFRKPRHRRARPVEPPQLPADHAYLAATGNSPDTVWRISPAARPRAGGRHHFTDPRLFRRRLRCLVAIDLKIGSFGHEDAGR